MINSEQHVTFKTNKYKHMKLKHIYISIVCLLITCSVLAQNSLTKKKQTIKVNKNVTVYLESSHTNLEVETWNKDLIDTSFFTV